jgi:protein tyrosine phosphatase
VIEEMTKIQIRSGNKPIVVHCSDTVTRSGMFCAIATTIERCKTEGVVDVFQVVKALRVQKPGAVPTVVSKCMQISIIILEGGGISMIVFALFPPGAGKL